MSYSEFTTLDKIRTQFKLTLVESLDLFTNVPEIQCSHSLAETLSYNLPLALAINSEKARSEMIITPILLETRKLLNSKFSLFSGINFDVDIEQGLSGYCDYIISRNPEQLALHSPVVTLVEAKKENLNGGLGQCAAEMVAAQIFNQREDNKIDTIYGVVTSGTNWKFLQLSDHTLEIDLNEYLVGNVNKIAGIIAYSIGMNT